MLLISVVPFFTLYIYILVFPTRYVRAEVIAGFVNGLFLLFVAFFIFAEAIEVSMELCGMVVVQCCHCVQCSTVFSFDSNCQ